MELIKENDYCKIVYDAGKKLFEYKWKPGSENLDNEGFKTLLLEFAEMLKQRDAESFFADAREKQFIMTDEMQVWHDEVIVPKYVEAGIKRIAFCVEEFTPVDIAIEMTFDEENSKNLQTQFFDSVDLAKKWLSKDTIAV